MVNLINYISNFVFAQIQVRGLLCWPEAKPSANTGLVTLPIRNHNFIN